MESTATIKNQELLDKCLQLSVFLKKKYDFPKLKDLNKTCLDIERSISNFLSNQEKEVLYKHAWLGTVYVNHIPPEVKESASLLEYEPTPDVMGEVFAERFSDSVNHALMYLYSELIGKVFPIPQKMANYFADRIEFITWNGVAVDLRRVSELIEESPNIYLVGSKGIKGLVSFMTFIPETK